MRECPVCFKCYNDDLLHCPQDHKALSDPLPWPLIIDGKYQLNALIGRGGMSSVYRANQMELARAVAIKLLLPNKPTTDASAPERFRREALASASIDHPNVVTIYDFGTLPSGAGYIVMKLLKGNSLSREIRLYRQLPFERIFNIMFQICSAIEVAHRQGIVHCDLKPDNIILEESEDGEQVQILDFGIAKILKRDELPAQVTQADTVLGTPMYMSPEQCESRELDFRTDIYSLGIILYEMLTGSPPFQGDHSNVIAQQHLFKPVPTVTKLRSQVKPKLEHALFTALAKPRDNRFQSASAFMEALREAAQEMVSAGLIEADALPQLAPKRRRITQTLQNLLPYEDTPTAQVNPIDRDNPAAVYDTLRVAIDTPPPQKNLDTIIPPTVPLENERQMVMVIDDEMANQMILEEIVQRLDCDTMVADNGQMALSLLQTRLPDLIISDILMPVMDGFQFYEEIRKDKRFEDIPFIFLTARLDHGKKLEALSKGVEDYWTKPFDVAEIVLRLQRILSRLKRFKKLEQRSSQY